MRKIISVSRRTDIPTFYGPWFMNRISEGFAGYVNPFGGKKHIVSLKPVDVICFIFWSKDFRPFLKDLETLEAMGYNFYFNYTLTGLPSQFEKNLPGRTESIETIKTLSRRYSPEAVNWRYDPVIISRLTDLDFHRENFRYLTTALKGYVKRCYFSFVQFYKKLEGDFDKLKRKENLVITNPTPDSKTSFTLELAEIAAKAGMELYSCCGEHPATGPVKKAHCVDGEVIGQLFYPGCIPFKRRPTRKGCGCTESTDIGAYNTCPHGCVYCYANTNHPAALRSRLDHDPQAPFLRYSKDAGDRWVAEIKGGKPEQGRLFE